MITLDHVSKSYSSKIIMKSVSFALSPASITLLVGENGAGKTTLLNLIAGIEIPDSGTILIEGKRLGYIGHHVAVYPALTAVENLLFWGKLSSLACSSEDILAILERVNLLPFANQSVKIFSRGMLQRLNLGRILLTKPDILLLDEPSTGLDTFSVQMLYREILLAKEQGACIIWSTHHAELDGVIAERVIWLKDKTIALLDSKEYLRMMMVV
ncbi:MAG: ABC transporter ATP-binding protein [Desulfovibrionaceae bacterium]